ncbi:hypothetical protein NL676_014991 [Syzygium grande]|nr:hypothetical protein NL676_014991 [Syzygium grande]
MSLWRKKLVVHSNLAVVSNGHMQNPITRLPPGTLPSSFSRRLPPLFSSRSLFLGRKLKAVDSAGLHGSGLSAQRFAS